MRIGYAPGRCLRAWLNQLGYAPQPLHQAGLVNANGYDTYAHRIIFPLEGNLYGRSIGDAAPHRFLPGGKGGLYAWEQARQCEELIVVEGLFDYAVLRQAAAAADPEQPAETAADNGVDKHRNAEVKVAFVKGADHCVTRRPCICVASHPVSFFLAELFRNQRNDTLVALAAAIKTANQTGYCDRPA